MKGSRTHKTCSHFQQLLLHQFISEMQLQRRTHDGSHIMLSTQTVNEDK